MNDQTHKILLKKSKQLWAYDYKDDKYAVMSPESKLVASLDVLSGLTFLAVFVTAFSLAQLRKRHIFDLTDLYRLSNLSGALKL